MFCCTLLYVHSSIAIILMGKRQLVALLYLSSWCLAMVELLFLAVPWGCLRFVTVVFPDHTHLLFFKYTNNHKFAVTVHRRCIKQVCNRRLQKTTSRIIFFYDFPLKESLKLSSPYVTMTTAFFKLTTSIKWICVSNGKRLSSVKLHLLKQNSYRRI